MVAGVPPDSPSRVFVVDAVLTAESETASEPTADDGRMVKFVKRVEVNGPGALNVGPCDGETRLEIPEILPDCVTVVVADSDSVIAAEMDADDVGNVGNTDELLIVFGEPDCEEEVAGDVDSATVDANVEDVWLLADDPPGVFWPIGHVSCSALAGPCVMGLQPGKASMVPRTCSLKTDGCWGQVRAKLTSWLGARYGQALMTPPSSVYRQFFTASS